MNTEWMDDEFLYKKIQDALRGIPENFNILEEQIDVALQAEYFEFSRKFRSKKTLGNYIRKKEQLFDPETSIKIKKKILAALASSAEVEDFRTIERYHKAPDPELKEWSILALQESRMLIQSALLDEQQIFISTGLGGKGQKLRYFVVFLNKSGGELSDMQRKLLHDELVYALKKANGELEELNSMIDFTTAMVVLPITSPLKDLFQGVIDECNQYGDFLQEDMVITNVKKLNPIEILDLLKQQKEAGQLPEEEDPEY
ncbi:MAG: hypothetical protein ACOZDD_08540 [Bacteroidota bacterium]